MMRVCILKGPDDRHDYFAKKLMDIEGVECLVFTHKRTSYARIYKMLLKSPKTFINRIAKYFLYSLRKWSSREKLFFGQNNILNEIVVKNYNHRDTIERIKLFKPDIVAVFGTPIISNEIIGIPKFGSINLHGGISPEYKGGNTIFWALYNNDLEKVGATLHYMVEKVDSGDILATIYPDINSKDDEFSVSVKTFKYAVDEFVYLVKSIAQKNTVLVGEKQVKKGCLYLAKDRNFLKDIYGIYKIKLNLQDFKRSKAINRFYE